jgi:putative nucleotidyltransferase with HDIG domain
MDKNIKDPERTAERKAAASTGCIDFPLVSQRDTPKIYNVELMTVVRTLTTTVDLAGINEIYHGKRVAIITMALAQVLGWQDATLDRLYRAAMLHDCGVSRSGEHTELVNQFQWEKSQEHCKRGSQYLAEVSVLADLAPIVLLHHTEWETMKSSAGEETARFANLIFLADRIDALRAQHELLTQPERVNEIIPIIELHRGTTFASEFVDAACEVARREAFWFDLDDSSIEFVHDLLPIRQQARLLDWHEMREIGILFARIIDAKSVFTAEHSVRVAAIALALARLVGLHEFRCREIEFAALVHDIGKLRMPDELLDKKGAYSPRERQIMTQHPYETMKLLSRLFGRHPIVNWAAWHHETLLGTGYPFHMKGDELPLEARIVAVADIFQALLQDRPYRARMSVERALGILDALVAEKKLDGDLVTLLRNNLALCVEAAI